jgi:hypothetical protein
MASSASEIPDWLCSRSAKAEKYPGILHEGREVSRRARGSVIYTTTKPWLTVKNALETLSLELL